MQEGYLNMHPKSNASSEKGIKYKDLKDIIEIYLTKQDIFKKRQYCL